MFFSESSPNCHVTTQLVAQYLAVCWNFDGKVDVYLVLKLVLYAQYTSTVFSVIIAHVSNSTAVYWALGFQKYY